MFVDDVPPEIVNENTGWVGSEQVSMFRTGAREVFGNVVSLWRQV